MRVDGRAPDALRPVVMDAGWKKQADGSVLYRAGGTLVLCVASVDEGVKDFLRGRGQGWVTAEYLMHPRAGGRRQSRDGFNGRPVSGRAQEIARLVGRSLRAAVNLKALGERTITVDCDVLEADGGTRTASVTGAMVALALCLDGLRRKGLVHGPCLHALVAAVSVGMVHGEALLDLDYVEDSAASMDLNLVGTASGDVVELQATSEDAPVPRPAVDRLVSLGLEGVGLLVHQQRQTLYEAGVDVGTLLPSEI